MAHPTHRYTLKWSKMIAPTVKHLTFEKEDGTPLLFQGGQFITLHIEKVDKIVHRSYSIANAPNQVNCLELACAYVEGGVASSLLFGLKPGDFVLASGPFGLFVLKEERPARYILVATGTGVSPYRSMLQDIKNRLENTHPELEVILIFGVRTRNELLYKDEFLKFMSEYPRFKFIACYSRESLDNPETFERQGHVQAALADVSLNPAQDIVYLCGNPNMIDATFALLTESGFDKKNVRREKYLFSK